MSDTIILNSGTPQGCILSSVLFSLYINDIQVHDAFLLLIKYADDLALIGRLKNEFSLGCYLNEIKVLTDKLKDRFLELNVNKTKELLLGNSPLLKTDLVNIDGNTVERVDCFKYLGTYVDEKLKFKQHAESTFKKCQQRLFLLRKLRSFNVSGHILILVYKSLIESILAFNIVTWFNFLTVTEKSKLNRIVNISSKIVGEPQMPLSMLYNKALSRQAKHCTNDSTHPLFSEFSLMPSGRRYRMPLSRKCIFKKSFVPSAISFLNLLSTQPRRNMSLVV